MYTKQPKKMLIMNMIDFTDYWISFSIFANFLIFISKVELWLEIRKQVKFGGDIYREKERKT